MLYDSRVYQAVDGHDVISEIIRRHTILSYKITEDDSTFEIRRARERYIREITALNMKQTMSN